MNSIVVNYPVEINKDLFTKEELDKMRQNLEYAKERILDKADEIFETSTISADVKESDVEEFLNS